jgi:RNA recognition motif-containing protein
MTFGDSSDDKDERAYRALVTMQNCVRVTNLPPSTTEAEVRHLCDAWTVTDVILAVDPNGACVGYAFVSFATMVEAEAAQAAIHGRGGLSANITHNGPIARQWRDRELPSAAPHRQ